jgi:hypothetical protein
MRGALGTVKVEEEGSMDISFRSLCLVASLAFLCCLGAASAAAASPAKDAAVKEGIHALQVGIQSYAVDHNDHYPRFISNAHFKALLYPAYVDNWPRNPYRDRPMRARFRRAGDFTYRVSQHRDRFLLVGWGHGGVRVIRVP